MIFTEHLNGGRGGRGRVGEEEPAEGGEEVASPDFLSALEEFIGVNIARGENEEEAEEEEKGIGKMLPTPGWSWEWHLLSCMSGRGRGEGWGGRT